VTYTVRRGFISSQLTPATSNASPNQTEFWCSRDDSQILVIMRTKGDLLAKLTTLYFDPATALVQLNRRKNAELL
jgi:hypothetical protein